MSVWKTDVFPRVYRFDGTATAAAAAVTVRVVVVPIGSLSGQSSYHTSERSGSRVGDYYVVSYTRYDIIA